MIRQEWYEVQEGMRNPRAPEEVSWRGWGVYATSGEAHEVYQKLPKPARVVHVTVVIEKT